jgi:hypothetical protein
LSIPWQEAPGCGRPKNLSRSLNLKEAREMKTFKIIFLSALVAVIFVVGVTTTPKTRNSFILPSGYCAQCLEQMEGA